MLKILQWFSSHPEFEQWPPQALCEPTSCCLSLSSPPSLPHGSASWPCCCLFFSHRFFAPTISSAGRLFSHTTSSLSLFRCLPTQQTMSLLLPTSILVWEAVSIFVVTNSHPTGRQQKGSSSSSKKITRNKSFYLLWFVVSHPGLWEKPSVIPNGVALWRLAPDMRPGAGRQWTDSLDKRNKGQEP